MTNAVKELHHKANSASKDHKDEKELMENDHQKHSDILEQKYQRILDDNNALQKEK